MKSKSFKIILSLIIVFLSYGFIIYKLVNLQGIKDISFSFQHYTLNDLILFLIVIMLMFINWSIETIKWKKLVDKIQLFTFTEAFKAIFLGISIGIFTPNRIGEIGGRVMLLEKGKRTFGVIATGMGSLAQFITTIACGILGLILFLILFPDKFGTLPLFNTITAMLLFILFIILIWSYFNMRKMMPFLLKFSFFKNQKKQLNCFSETQFPTLLKILLLSFLRYLVFVSQFFLLLWIFNIYLTFSQAFISISMIYLFATIIPTTTLIELGIRGSLAILFIGLFSKNIVGIVASTSILWIINLAIPAIMGSVFLLKKSFK